MKDAILTFIGCYLIVGSLWGLVEMFRCPGLNAQDRIVGMFLHITSWPIMLLNL